MNNKLKLNVQHDYITLKTPNGNFTVSWGRYKASGRMAEPKVFNKLVEFCEKYKVKYDNGKVMEMLSNEKVLSKLWPEWDMVYEYDFKIGDVVIITGLKKLGKGIIQSFNKKGAPIIKFDSGLVQASMEQLEHSK